jgi:parvulin-like peptidyl-prolyl isomerase
MTNDQSFQLAFAIDEWIKKNFSEKTKVSKEEAEKFYRENQERFKTPEAMKIAHILIKNKIPRDKEGNALKEFAKSEHANLEDATVDGKRRADYENLKDATVDGKRRADYKNIKDAKLSGDTDPDSQNAKDSDIQGKDHADRENISIADREAERRLHRPNLSETKLARDVSQDSPNIKDTESQAKKHLDRVNLEEADRLAKLKAEGLHAKLLQGEDFEKIAKQNSDCGISAKHGGNLGYMPRGQMFKEFEEAAFALKPGEISKVVKTREGYHIIKALDKKQGGYVSFEKLEPMISRRLKNNKIKEEIRKTLDAEKEKMKIKLNI